METEIKVAKENKKWNSSHHLFNNTYLLQFNVNAKDNKSASWYVDPSIVDPEEVMMVCSGIAKWKFGIGRYINHAESKKDEASNVFIDGEWSHRKTINEEGKDTWEPFQVMMKMIVTEDIVSNQEILLDYHVTDADKKRNTCDHQYL